MKEKIYECIYEIMQDNDIVKDIDDDIVLDRDNGFDSLGIVNLVVLLEEKLNIELDNYLGELRGCKKVGDLVRLIEMVENN